MLKRKNRQDRQGTKLIALFVCVFCAFCITACSKKVMIRIEAERDLNMDFDEPHTLELLIFQLKNEKDFDDSWQDYLSDNYDRSKVLGDPVRKIVLPGSTFEVEILKEKEVNFIGIIAGYYKPRVPLRVREIVKISRRRPRLTLKLGPDGIRELQQ